MTDYLREGMVEKVKYSIARRRMENQVNFRTQRAVDAVPPGGSPVPVLPRTDNRRVND